jgi:hypothetical protein
VSVCVSVSLRVCLSVYTLKSETVVGVSMCVSVSLCVYLSVYTLKRDKICWRVCVFVCVSVGPKPVKRQNLEPLRSTPVTLELALPWSTLICKNRYPMVRNSDTLLKEMIVPLSLCKGFRFFLIEWKRHIIINFEANTKVGLSETRPGPAKTENFFHFNFSLIFLAALQVVQRRVTVSGKAFF